MLSGARRQKTLRIHRWDQKRPVCECKRRSRTGTLCREAANAPFAMIRKLAADMVVAVNGALSAELLVMFAVPVVNNWIVQRAQPLIRRSQALLEQVVEIGGNSTLHALVYCLEQVFELRPCTV